MSLSIADSGHAPRPRGLLRPTVWAVGLLTAVFLVPFPVASWWPGGGYPDRVSLVGSLSTAFVHYWHTGSGPIGPDLTASVEFWRRFHVVKAVLAAVALVSLLSLGRRSWVAYPQAATAARRLGAAALTVLTGLLAMLSLLVLVANLQGAVAPLSSALGLLPVNSPGPDLEAALGSARSDLAAGVRGPALAALVDDFSRYHLAMAGLGAVVTVGLLALAVLVWRRRARTAAVPHSGRTLLAVAVAALLVSAAFFGVVTAGNLSTVAHPAPALLGFFEGGQ